MNLEHWIWSNNQDATDFLAIFRRISPSWMHVGEARHFNDILPKYHRYFRYFVDFLHKQLSVADFCFNNLQYLIYRPIYLIFSCPIEAQHEI